MEITLKDDIRLVQNARRNSYLIDTEYTVGAVVKAKSGKKYTGSNIELNSSEMIWAEKVAILKAISEGEREFDYILVMGGDKNKEPENYLPCKECREVINKFVDKEFKLYSIYNNKINAYDFSKLILE